MSIAAINHEGFLLKKERIFALNSPFLLSNSILILLEDINAISIPEKKAENKRDVTVSISKKMADIIIFYFLIFCLILFLLNIFPRTLQLRDNMPYYYQNCQLYKNR